MTAYRLFDKSNKGYFTKSELKEVLKRFTSGNVKDTDIDQIMSMGVPLEEILAGAGSGASRKDESVISKDIFISLFK